MALALFDLAVSIHKKMVASIHDCVGEDSPAKRPRLNSRDLARPSVTWCRPTRAKFQIEADFLEVNPGVWPQRDDFNTAATRIGGIAVINDHADRGAALVKGTLATQGRYPGNNEWLYRLPGDGTPDQR